MNDNSPSGIKEILEKFNISLKKRWGQNFLISAAVRKKILDYVGPVKGSVVWEIGPGLGSMTNSLLAAGARVVAFEIDWGMIRFLQQRFSGCKTFTLVQGDVVKTWESAHKDYGKPAVVMGNLPYASASAIIGSFIGKEFIPDALVFTVQRELALRLAARPRTKNYSSFSILFQTAFVIKEKQDVKQGSFYPVPDVVSSVIYAVPARPVVMPYHRDLFFNIVKTGFSSRRKTLLNNLLSGKELKVPFTLSPEKAIEKIGFNRKTRGEELSVEDFIRLANILYGE